MVQSVAKRHGNGLIKCQLFLPQTLHTQVTWGEGQGTPPPSLEASLYSSTT